MANDTQQNIDVDLIADGQHLNKAVDDFVARLQRVKQMMDQIGMSSRTAALSFDKETRATLSSLQKGMSQLAAVEKLNNSNKLSPAEELRAQKQIGEYQIRQLKDRDTLEANLDRLRRNRDVVTRQLQNATNKDIQNSLSRQIQLYDHLERRTQRRLDAVQRIARAEAAATTAMAKKSAVQNILSPGYMGAAMARTSVYGMGAMAVYGAYNALRDGVRFAIELEDALANLQAIAAATDAQMGHLSATVLEVSRNSKFATSELVEATTTLAQAGFSVRDLEGAIESVANLSIATGTDLKTSADTMASAVGAFQLQASETGRISDAMTAALNRSKLTIQQVGQAFQYAGATAFENNMTFEELLATAGALSNAGIARGSTIGTGLRQFLVDLQDPSKKLIAQLDKVGLTIDDVNVAAKGFAPVLQRLKDAGFDSAEAYAALETRSAAAFLVAKNNIPTIYELMEAQQQAGVAADAAAVSMNSVAAQWQRFKNLSGELTFKVLSDDLETLKSVLRGVSDATEWWLEKAKNLDDRLLANINLIKEQRDEAQRNGFTIMDYGLAVQQAALENMLFDQSLSTTAGRLEAAENAVIEATEAYNSKMETVYALDDALIKLISQEDRYRGNSREVNLAVLSLARQFEGLGSTLMDVAGNYDVLIERAEEFRAVKLQEALTLSTTRAMDGRRQATQATYDLQDRVRSSGLPKFADSKLQTAWTRAWNTNRVANPDKTQAAVTLNDFSKLLSSRGTRGEQSRGNAYINSMQKRLAGMSIAVSSDMDAKSLAAQLTPEGLEAARKEREEAARSRTERNVPENKSKTKTPTGRQNNQEARADRLNARTGLKSAELRLDATYEKLKEPLGVGDFSELASQAKTDFENWRRARESLAKAEIANAKMTEEQARVHWAEVNKEIAVKSEERSRLFADSIMAMYDKLTEDAQRAFDISMQPFEARVAIEEGKLASYDRSFNRNTTPDYVRKLQEHEVELANEARDQAELDALLVQLEAQQQALADLRAARAAIEAGVASTVDGSSGLDANGGIVVTAQIKDLSGQVQIFSQRDLPLMNEKAQEAEIAIAGLASRADGLRASLATAIPPGFNDGLKQAAQAYRLTNGLSRTFEQDLTMGLGGAFSDVHGAMNTFFTDMINKPGQAAIAFDAFGESVIDMMKKMAAQALANQLMGLLINLIAPSVGGGLKPVSGMDGLVSSNVSGFNATPWLFNGGIVGYDSGGLVNHGVPNRDSVLTALARGEFVIRKNAVDSLGTGFLSDLNKRGDKALQGMGNMVVANPPARQEMSVYVVAQDEQPQLGPNDVLAIVNRDILKDGQTKRMIKHVAQGG